jgi:hypothetical protein
VPELWIIDVLIDTAVKPAEPAAVAGVAGSGPPEA